MFTVYSKPNCSFCDQAKALLKSKGFSFEEVHVDIGQPKVDGNKYVSAAELKQMIPSARTVPQILRDGNLVGGYTELRTLLS